MLKIFVPDYDDKLIYNIDPRCAENMVTKMKIERKEQDDYAKLSFE